MRAPLRYRETYKGRVIDLTAHTKKELNDKVTAKKAQIDAGYKPTGITVHQWADRWLETYKAPKVSKKTLEDYKTILNKIDLSIPLDQVKPIHLQTILNGMAGQSDSLIHKYCVLTKAMFRDAMANGLTATNPAEHLQKPKGVTNQRRAITKEERALIEKVMPHSEAGPFIALMLYAGLRPSEAGNVIGADVDLARRRLHVRGTKTASADRYVPITDRLLPYISRLDKNEYAVLDSSGNPTTKDSRRNLWQRFRRELNLEAGARVGRKSKHSPHDLPLEDLIAPDLVPYCLRHTFCTDLEATGVPINIARDLMGHSDISVTAKIYTHRTDAAFDDAMEKMNKI